MTILVAATLAYLGHGAHDQIASYIIVGVLAHAQSERRGADLTASPDRAKLSPHPPKD